MRGSLLSLLDKLRLQLNHHIVLGDSVWDNTPLLSKCVFINQQISPPLACVREREREVCLCSAEGNPKYLKFLIFCY